MTFHKTISLAAISVCLSIGISRADECNTSNTQLELNECVASKYKDADTKLNALYASIPKSPKLVAAERAWLAYRDAECSYQANQYTGGSLELVTKLYCLKYLTEQRIKDLSNGH